MEVRTVVSEKEKNLVTGLLNKEPYAYGYLALNLSIGLIFIAVLNLFEVYNPNMAFWKWTMQERWVVSPVTIIVAIPLLVYGWKQSGWYKSRHEK